MATTRQLPETVKKVISDIKIIVSGSGNYEPLVDFGYNVLPHDLNRDAGGNYVYVQYKEEPEGQEAIDSLGFLVNGQVTPENWVKLPEDLNSGVGGSPYIYLSYDKTIHPANPIRRLMITHNNQQIPEDFEVGKNLISGAPQDLAQGTGNDLWIYLSYSREQPQEDAWGD